MAAKVSGEVKAVKATPAGSNGAPTVARIKPVPAKVIRNLMALGEPHRLAVLGYVASASGPVMLADVAGRLGGNAERATLVVNHLKQRGWLASDRVPKASGGGWRYRLSDAGRERLMALGG